MKDSLKKSIVSWCIPGKAGESSNSNLKGRMELARETGFDAIELTRGR